MFKKRNLVSKLWLKHTNRPAYKAYKWELVNQKQAQFTSYFIGESRLNNISKINGITNATHKLNLLHSGNAGDIIYALPTLKKIYEVTGVKVNLYFLLGKPMNLPNYSSHPLGNVMLNQKMADMLFPLIRPQLYINLCEVYNNQEIDIELDYFRAGVVPQDKGNIARWCGYITGVTPQLWKKWLSVEPDKQYNNTIVIARSARYQNKFIDYSFINKYQDVVFIGVESEYKEMKGFMPKIKWVEMSDFMQMAQIIAGCKFFIGNQSFPYSVAEALKIPRILETSYEVINVVPEGEGGHDFFFQEHFESLVSELNGDGI